jgi:hypothetical protein
MIGFKNSWNCTREDLAASLDTVEYYEDMNPLGNDFEPNNKKRKNGPFNGSSDPITDSPSSTGPLWNLIGQKDICIPLTINVAFIEIFFKSKAELMASLSTSKYKQGEKTVNKKPNANMRVRTNSSYLGERWFRKRLGKGGHRKIVCTKQ